MTERKPPGVTWETWIDRLIREARERGEFDNLPGTGKPIADIDRPRDEMWWVRQLLQREEVGYTPPALALRKAAEDAMAEVARQHDEGAVRRIVEELNERIRKLNRTPITGPPSDLMPFDVDQVVATWRRARTGSDA
jgi:hypothetical protein